MIFSYTKPAIPVQKKEEKKKLQKLSKNQNFKNVL